MKTVKSMVIPVRRDDVDTDLIIPADYLKITDKKGLGAHLFERIRGDIGLGDADGRSIMVAGENFGCGSSREHAAWALKDFGVQVVVAKSFADIFYNNALKNLILPVEVEAEVVNELMSFESEVEVNLEAMVVRFDGREVGFELEEYRRECLLKEMDDLDYILSCSEAIEKFDKARRKKLFFNVSAL